MIYIISIIIKYNFFTDISDENINKLNIPNSVPCVFDYDMQSGKRIGQMKFLADEEYVKKESAKVAAIGN